MDMRAALKISIRTFRSGTSLQSQPFIKVSAIWFLVINLMTLRFSCFRPDGKGGLEGKGVMKGHEREDGRFMVRSEGRS